MEETGDSALPDKLVNPSMVEQLSGLEVLIGGTIEALRSAEGTDVPLLDILSEHILTMNPANTAVADTMTAIAALAAKRAEGSGDDQADHD